MNIAIIGTGRVGSALAGVAAGDDAEATVAALAADLGFEPQDAGPLRLVRTGLTREFAWGLLRR